MNQSAWRQLAIASNWPVLAAVGVLTAVGVISIWAVDPAEGTKQLVFAGIGFVCLLAIQTVNYQVFARFAWGLYLFSLAPVVYTVLGALLGNGQPGNAPLPFVHYIGGAYAWITLGPVSLQPSELTKIGFILVMSHYLRYRSNYRTFVGLLAPFMLAVVPLGLILKQPDLGTGLTFIPPLFAMVFVAGAKWRHLFAILGLGLALAPVAWLSGQPDVPVFRHFPTLIKPYQRARVYGLFSKTDSSKGINYQQDLAETAMGTGSWTGKGFTEIPIGRRVPEADSDMVFSIIGEQFGFIGSVIVLTAYIVLFASGVEIAAETREPFGKLCAVGLIALLAGQAFINLFVVLRLMPVTGLPLPFVSYGGSSLLASYIAAGLLLNMGQNRPLIMAKDSFEFE